jgi:small subunit ribosomal protein S20
MEAAILPDPSENHVPNSPSAEKRVRQNRKQNAINNHRKRLVKDSVKQFMSAAQAGDAALAEKQLREAMAILDRVAAKRTIHPNTAARRKSLLARRLNALRSPKSDGAAATKSKSRGKA